jgi:hypothetical protein
MDIRPSGGDEASYYYWQALVDRTKTIIGDYKEIFKKKAVKSIPPLSKDRGILGVIL